MRAIRNHPDAIHLPDYRPAEVAQSSVRRLRTAVTDHVSAVIRKMHDADSVLKEDADIAEFVFHGIPLLRERHSIAGKIKAMLSRLLGGYDFIRHRCFCLEVA